MNNLTWTILKKTQILNGCETFAFKYNAAHIQFIFLSKIYFKLCTSPEHWEMHATSRETSVEMFVKKTNGNKVHTKHDSWYSSHILKNVI